MTKADHQHAAEHHIRVAKLHKAALAGLRKARGMADDEEPEDDGDDLADFTFHKAAMSEHTEMASHHLQMCKASTGDFAKADGMDRDGIRPDLISLIAPEVPQHIRAVPRAGQRELGKTDAVDPVLSKVFGEDEI